MHRISYSIKTANIKMFINYTFKDGTDRFQCATAYISYKYL